MAISKKLCKLLAKILHGEGEHKKDECTIMVKRKLHAKILGKEYDTEHEIVIQSLSNGKSLNTGELTVLQKEVNPLLNALKKQGFLVTAIHNHWLFDKPRLMYIHIENVGNPIRFAKRLHEALKVLKN
jgi:hypothetical protein